MTRLLLTTAVFIAVVGLAQRPARAEAPWCAVTSEGGDVHWDCEYKSVEECAPNVLAGNRGFCNPNPRYHGPEPRRVAPRHRGRRH